eukprot:scaffold1739_cov67-Phaeocystis_antarctica.AAC.1
MLLGTLNHTPASLSCSQAAAHERPPPTQAKAQPASRDTKSHAPTPQLSKPQLHALPPDSPRTFAGPMSFSPYTHKVLVRCERQTCHRTGELASGHNWHEASRHSAAPYPRRADGVAPWAWPCGLRVIGVATGRMGN